MPIGKKLPRYKTIRCTQPQRHVIARFDRKKYKGGHVPVGDIFAAIRRHYKRHHPAKFKQMVRKAKYARKKKR